MERHSSVISRVGVCILCVKVLINESFYDIIQIEDIDHVDHV